MIIFELRKILQHGLAREIFDRVWQISNGTEITPNLLQAMVHSGSYLSGAFMDGKCVGAALSLIHISEPTRPY